MLESLENGEPLAGDEEAWAVLQDGDPPEKPDLLFTRTGEDECVG